MENNDKKNSKLSDGEIMKFSAHERYIWDHLVNSIPDNMEKFPHYYSPLTDYEKTIDFNERINIEKLEIPLHVYLKNNTFHHPILDELNLIIEENDIVLSPLNNEDSLKFINTNGIQVRDNKETDWDYYMSYSMDDFNVEPGFAAFSFTYKGFSMAAISIHPGGNIDIRGPFMESKVYLLKYGDIFDSTSIKGYLLGTNIVLNKRQIKDQFFYNEALNIWQHKINNQVIEIKITKGSPIEAFENVSEILK
jgi:hypothetical protein